MPVILELIYREKWWCFALLCYSENQGVTDVQVSDLQMLTTGHVHSTDCWTRTALAQGVGVDLQIASPMLGKQLLKHLAPWQSTSERYGQSELWLLMANQNCSCCSEKTSNLPLELRIRSRFSQRLSALFCCEKI